MTDIRLGNGFDVHAFGPGDHVTLCGVSVAHDHGLVGHSDADVGLHAITDAIYGALGAGDIGQHFPPYDPQWKGADSDIFLRHAAQLARKRGYAISNVDCTLICEFPKIGPHSAAMRARVADIIDVAPDRVSVKATTSEKLGFTGRGEGIAALATCALVQNDASDRMPSTPRAWIARMIGTVMGVGYVRPAPGTWGSLVALPWAWLLHVLGGFPLLLLAIVVGFLKGWWATAEMTVGEDNHDPSEIVIDEVIGQWIAVLPLSYAAWNMDISVLALWPGWIAAFVLFRFFDITKLWIVGWADKRDDAFGVMLDDVFAGILAALGVLALAALAHGVFM